MLQKCSQIAGSGLRLLRPLAALYFAFTVGALWEMRTMQRRLPNRGPEVLSWHPRVLLARNFLTEGEAAHVLALAARTATLRPSGTGTSPGQQGAQRTSSTAWLYKQQDSDEVLSSIVDRMHSLAMLPREHGEPIALARYQEGEYYGWHFDSDERELRLATVLVYLQEPKAGGETIFPFALGGGGPVRPPPFNPAHGGGPNPDTPFQPYCSSKGGQLKVAPRAGDALVFFSHRPSLEADFAAWHASCPVLGGTKWIMQRWIKAVPFSKWVQATYNISFDEWKRHVAAAENVRQATAQLGELWRS